jgi:hypothetical protein
MTDILKKLDVIHAEAVKRAEFDKLMRYDNVIVQQENKRHIDNICKLRNMIKKALDNMATVTNDTQGDYYLTDEQKADLGSTAGEQTDDLGFQEFSKTN